MKLATTTTILSARASIPPEDTIFEEMRLCKQAGFSSIDIRLSTQAKPGYPLSMDNWTAWVARVREAADHIGLDIPQAHAFVYRTSESTDMTLNRDWYDERIRRSIMAAGVLGIPWVVMHPLDFCRYSAYSFEKNRAFNLCYWTPFVALAASHDVGIAFENLYPSGPLPQRYCSEADELIDLVDSFKTGTVGVCWDTGHAAVAQQDQPRALRKIGKRLKALHIHDNHCLPQGDEHLPPYLGALHWDGIFAALSDIAYDNTFSFEIKDALHNAPPQMSGSMLSYIHQLGLFMIDQIEQHAKKRVSA